MVKNIKITHLSQKNNKYLPSIYYDIIIYIYIVILVFNYFRTKIKIPKQKKGFFNIIFLLH